MTTNSTLKPGTADFLNALADLIAQRDNETIATLPEDLDILEQPYEDTPFAWVASGLTWLEAKPKGTSVDDVIMAMGVTAFVCPSRGLVDGPEARRGFAFGIGSERRGPEMTGREVAGRVRGIIEVMPPPLQ